MCYLFFFFQAEDGIRDLVRSRGLGDVYKRQDPCNGIEAICAFWDFGHSEGMQITPTKVETVVCSNEGILKAVMEVRNINDNSGMDISIVDHFVVDERGKITSGRAFWDESSISQPKNVNTIEINVEDFKDRG